ncbi:MAG: hypothetical protein MZV64_35975 [Ignavibacteriales bacterium]|nr:hypothetical protein [Ignavibacteriales bacterium]
MALIAAIAVKPLVLYYPMQHSPEPLLALCGVLFRLFAGIVTASILLIIKRQSIGGGSKDKIAIERACW